MSIPTIGELAKAAEAKGLNVERHVFDGGVTVTMSAPSMPTWRGSCAWGDEDYLVERAERWLTTLPLSEDDPSVQHEGVYE